MYLVTVEAEKPPTLGLYVLYYCVNLATIYVPASKVDTYKGEDGWKDYASKIVAISTT